MQTPTAATPRPTGQRPAAPGLLFAPRLSERSVPHAFSTRLGGVSSGIFDSLNFGNPAELAPPEKDPPANIAENFRIVLGALGAAGRQVVQVHQVHGAAVHTVRAGQPSHGGASDTRADAIVTDDPSRMLAVRVADCAPILLASIDGRIVAAVHAGWRGTVAGVLGAAIGAMRSFGATDIVAAIGPCIGPGAFEVGAEVRAEFERIHPGARNVVHPGPGGKCRIDLQESLRLQALAAGVTRIEVVNGCTATDAASFFSHRRDNGRSGRMIGIIGPVSVGENLDGSVARVQR